MPQDLDRGALLDREFKEAIQATVAAATFFEALYVVTKDRSPSTAAPIPRTRRKHSPRYAVVAEQLRQTFGLRKVGTANLRSVLKEVYRFRGQAVHPTAAFTTPILHPQLNVGVERRFVMFSFENAKMLVRAALAFSKILPSRDLSQRPAEIQQFASYLLTICDPLYAQWEQNYGELLDQPRTSPSQPEV